MQGGKEFPEGGERSTNRGSYWHLLLTPSRGERTEYQPKKGKCGFRMFLFSAQHHYFSTQTPREVSVKSYRKWHLGSSKFGAGKSGIWVRTEMQEEEEEGGSARKLGHMEKKKKVS